MGTTVDSDMIAGLFFCRNQSTLKFSVSRRSGKKGVILKVASYIATDYIRSAWNVMLSIVDFLKVLLGYWSA
jgi:hypothetical protein